MCLEIINNKYIIYYIIYIYYKYIIYILKISESSNTCPDFRFIKIY